jgi:hypothetical protein
LITLVAVMLVGCGAIRVDDPRDDPVPTRTQLEVWNRTTRDVTLESDEGDRLEVASCGHATSDSFSTVRVEVKSGARVLFTFGAPAPHPAEVAPVYLVLTGDSRVDRPSFSKPENPLVPCK